MVSTPQTALEVLGTVMVSDGGETCSSTVKGGIRYTSTNVLQYCNSSAWQTISAGGSTAAAGANTQVQFNSGGNLGGSANFIYTLATGTLKAANHDTGASTGTYKLGGSTIITYPHAGADTTSFAVGVSALANQTANTLYNFAFGFQAGQWVSSGLYNTAIGSDALQGVSGTPLTGSSNTAVGLNALMDAQGAAANNTAVGTNALKYNSTGSGNSAFGQAAMAGVSGTPLTSATGYNTAIGDYALTMLQGAAANNTALGYQSGYYITTGTDNIAIGYSALLSTSGTPLTAASAGNIAVGSNALTALAGGATGNVAIGYNALTSSTVSSTAPNTAIGYEAMQYATTATNNTAIGNKAMQGVSATPMTGAGYNTAIGDSALSGIGSNARFNTAVGYSAIRYESSGNFNTALGYEAMQGTAGTPLTGISNTALGVDALLDIAGAAAQNVAVGASAGADITTGTGNTLLGSQAGITGTVLTTGTNNVYIGYNAAASGAAVTNETVLGYNATGNGSNTITLGNSSNTNTYAYGTLTLKGPTYYTAFAPGATSNQTYTLPVAYPGTTGYVLSSTTGGVMSWVANGGSSAIGSTTQVAYNASGTETGSANLTFDGTGIMVLGTASGAALTIGASGASTNKISLGPTTGASVPSAGVVGVAHALYSFATDGGAVSTITPAINSTIPAKAVITAATINSTTAVTSGGAATVAIGTTATGGSTTSFLAATGNASFTANALLNGATTFAAPLKVTAAGSITVTVGTAALTAGVIEIWVQYYVATN